MIFPKEWSTHKKLLFAMGLAGKAIEDTATGNPLTFGTDLAKPLKSLLIPFTPVQSGSGDPSPQNVRPIVPWEGLNVEHASRNAFDSYVESGEYGYNTGAETPSTTRIRSKKILLCKGTYTISSIGMSNVVIYVYDVNGNFMLNESIRMWKSQTYTFNVTGLRYIAFVWRKAGDPQITPQDISNVMLSVGSTEQTYEPPAQNTVYPISFPSPVYGGTLDVVSGVLTVEWAKVEIKNCYFSGTWDGSKGAYWYITLGEDVVAPKKKVGSGLGMCESLLPVSNVSTAETRDVIEIFDNNIVRWVDTEHMTLTRQEYREYLANNPIVICYQIATPQEITLTPEQITALKGENTIWSDANGEMTAVYLKKG